MNEKSKLNLQYHKYSKEPFVDMFSIFKSIWRCAKENKYYDLLTDDKSIQNLHAYVSFSNVEYMIRVLSLILNYKGSLLWIPFFANN